MLFTIWNRGGEKDGFKIDHDFIVTFNLTRAGTKLNTSLDIENVGLYEKDKWPGKCH